MPDDTDYDSELSDIPPAGESPVPRHLRRRKNATSSNTDDDGTGGGAGGDGDGDGNGNSDISKPIQLQIPRTWLSAAFTLSSCGTGLSFCKPDNDDTEMARLKSIQSTLFPIGTTTTIPGTAGATVTISASTQPPPPLPSFHCRGVTLLTSLITALIYSGVNSRRWKPFAELTLEERKKDFPQRLTDALFSTL